VLDDAHMKKWSEEEANRAIINNPERLKKVVLEDMTHEGKKRDLMSYEQVKVIEFIDEPFTIENGLLTPTFKSRRFAVEKKYKDLLLSLYTRIDA